MQVDKFAGWVGLGDGPIVEAQQTTAVVRQRCLHRQLPASSFLPTRSRLRAEMKRGVPFCRGAAAGGQGNFWPFYTQEIADGPRASF